MSEGEKPLVDDADSDINAIAFSGPAPAVNRFVVSLGPTGLRLTMLEEDTNKNNHFRAAGLMHPQDGIKLYKLLQGMLADFEEQLHEIERRLEDQPSGNE